MATFELNELHGSSVRFSPHQPNLLAVATTQFYGQNGNGYLFVLNTDDDFSFIQENRKFEWSQGLLDICWSKNTPEIVLTSSIDGSMQLWNVKTAENEKSGCLPPLQTFVEHTAEIYSVDWITINENPQLLSGSWDKTIKLWDPNRVKSLITYSDTTSLHDNDLIFSVSFSDCQRNTFCSVGGDGCLKLWSTNEPTPVRKIQMSSGELLCCDWSKCDENLIILCDSDGTIKVQDIRSLTEPLIEINIDDGVALKRVAFSTLAKDYVASVGYDGVTRYESFFYSFGTKTYIFLSKLFSYRIWNLNDTNEPLYSYCNHVDCATGVDWDPFHFSRLADCGWDKNVCIVKFP